jgi:hypothetical protein
MAYKRKLTANHYRGCSDNIARQIDRMAGLLPDTGTEYKLDWRGKDREIRSYNDLMYDLQKEKLNGKN